MYCQRIIINTFKYVQTHIKCNHSIAASIYPSNLRKDIFARYLPQISKIRNYKNYNKSDWSQIKFIISSGFLFNLFNSPKEEKDNIEDLKMTIKRSILLIQKQEFLKAEQMLHIALEQAQILQHYDGITYVYDIMANLAYDTNDFIKAEKLFVSVLQRLLSKGVPEDDLSVTHVSLKIADIYNKNGELEKAETGFKFCLKNLKNQLAKDSENQNTLQLLGLTLETYASMLFSHSKYVEALKYFNQAYRICIKINGEENEETIVLLSNLGSANYMLQEYDEAIKHLNKALELGKKFPDMDNLDSIHINLGNALLAKGLYEEAKKSCNEGKKLAKVKSDNESLAEAEKCLERIQSMFT